jgi:arylsulfatase A-like enzyme
MIRLRFPSTGRRRPVLAFALAAAVTLAGSAGCGDDRPHPRTLLITIDTLRAARIGAWGDPTAHTPWLDRMARRGRQYANARCDVPSTLPSHSTLFTGVPVIAHGVRLNGRVSLGPAAHTLAEEMSAAEWETAAIVSTWVLRSAFGLGQGFDSYEDRIVTPYRRYDLTNYPDFEDEEDMPKVQRRAETTSEIARRVLDRRRSRPLFLWVHYFDPHYPYDPPPPFSASPLGDPYAGEVAYTDHCLGPLLRRFEESGNAGHDRIAIAADHGESLGDFGEDEHGLLIYDATMRVPMVLAGRGVTAAGSVRMEVVTLADLGATLVADLARDEEGGGIGSTSPFGLGRDLLASADPPPDVPIYGESITSREDHAASGLKSLVHEGWKYVHAAPPELYDLDSDPGERRNLADREPQRLAALQHRLRAIVARLHGGEWRAAGPAPPARNAKEALRALGYLGGTGELPAIPTAEEEMALGGYNPRDGIRLMVAGRYLWRRLWSQAEHTLEEFLRLDRPDPATPIGRRLLAIARNDQGFLYQNTNRPERALIVFEEALRLQPDYESAMRGKADALRLLGRSDDLLAFTDSVLAQRPHLASMRAARVIALEALGRMPEAAEERRRMRSAAGRR